MTAETEAIKAQILSTGNAEILLEENDSFNHSFNKYIGNCTRYKIQFASLMQARERWQIPRWSCPLLLAQYFQRLRPGR